MKIDLISAARPNFMKIAPLYHQLKASKEVNFDISIIHTGQHYDKNMSDDFFKDLKLPNPDIHLGVGGGTQAEQVGKVMIEYEKSLIERNPDLVVVVGDVNSTMACSISAKKLNIKVAHLEAGIRSFDMSMPEEINRKVTDSIVDFFWTPSIEANENLIKEGIERERIKFVGNIMIDSFEMLKEEILELEIYKNLNLEPKNYIVVTFHRPSNVDLKSKLEEILTQLEKVSKDIKIVFPIHPRTEKNLKSFNLFNRLLEIENIEVIEPQSYLNFMNLVINSKAILTDSGGIQEESTYLKLPCLTLRDNTERPVTVWEGTNSLIKPHQIKEYMDRILNGSYKEGKIPLLWDGESAKRIVKEIVKLNLC